MSLAISGDTFAYIMSLGLTPEQAKGLLDRLAADALAMSPPSQLNGPKLRNEERVWVYVMTEDGPEMPLVKVGISKHPNYRRIELEKQCAANLYVAHTEGPFSARSEALEVERLAHEALASCRQHGEWFLVPEERAIEVVRNISRRGRA
jgi:hypothetical protein